MATAPAFATKAPLANAPGPKGRFLLGSLIEVSRDWLGFYKNCADEYGDVVRVHLAHVPVYLVVHPRDIETVLVTNAAKFTKSEDYRALARVLGRGLLTSEGDFWKRQRGLIQPAFHRQSILSYALVMTRAAGCMLDSWKEKVKRNIHEDMMRVTLEIVGQCLYSAEVTDAAERVGHAMEVVTGRFIVNASLAMLFRFDIPVRFAIREWRAIRELNEIIGGIIRERRSSGEPREDLLDMLLQARDADGNPMSDAQLRDEVMTLFLAGHETTAIALSWACYLIARNPHIEAKLAQELQTVLAGRVPTPEDLPRLRYTEMVLKETMRLYPRCGALAGEPWRIASLADTACQRDQTFSFCNGGRNAIRAFSPTWTDSPPRAGGTTHSGREESHVSHIFPSAGGRVFVLARPSR